MPSVTYNPAVFDVANMAQAKAIILTPEEGLSTEQRWEREAPYLVGLMAGLNLNSESVVLDYGCGIGRLSKALIEKYGCRVIGADISANMRTMASFHVASERFMVCHPGMLGTVGSIFDAALSVWVLQHTLKPSDDISAIAKALKAAGQLFVVNEKRRAVPAKEAAWVDDGMDLRAEISEKFDCTKEGDLEPDVVTQDVSKRTFWGLYGRRNQ